MLCRLIAAKWAELRGLKPKAFEGDYDFDQLLEFNERGYNVYFFPNYPSKESYDKIPINPNSKTGRKMSITGEYVDTFEYVFVDMDLKDYNSEDPDRRHEYSTKEQFIETILTSELLPTRITDSGNGCHVYWKVSDLDPMSFLRLNKRLCRKFHTDPSVTKLNQLMRVPNTLNVKKEDDFKLCEILYDAPENVYDSEALHKFLPPITPKDEKSCQDHYNMVNNIGTNLNDVSEELPVKFLKLCKENPEAKAIFYEHQRDRSIADFRLGHLMYAAGLTKEEARIPLMQTAKSSERTKQHRYSYAENILNKIWVESEKPSGFKILSKSMDELLNSPDEVKENTRFPCHPLIDATEHGFRLSEVLGLVGGQGNGKSTFSLNLFLWFIERNPDYIHLYVSLEQPEKEIAAKWNRMTKDLPKEINSSVHILGNHNKDGTIRNLSMKDITDYVLGLEKHLNKKIGCVVVDHIGILKQERKSDETSGLIGVCKELKAFSVQTNTFLVIQSQTTREKNGGGDLELDVDAAFGTSSFESFVDYIMTVWQPLRRIYKKAPHMTMHAFKLCKNRHRNVLKDKIQCDVAYGLKYEPETERLREMTSDEHKAFEFYQQQATAIRKKDKKTEPNGVVIIDWVPKAG